MTLPQCPALVWWVIPETDRAGIEQIIRDMVEEEFEALSCGSLSSVVDVGALKRAEQKQDRSEYGPHVYRNYPAHRSWTVATLLLFASIATVKSDVHVAPWEPCESRAFLR